MLDDSTTIHALAIKLINISHLTVITNCFSVVDVLRKQSQIKLIGLGGDCLFHFNAMAGDLCEQMIGRLRANKLFMSDP